MANDLLETIRTAEEQAAQIRAGASEKARQLNADCVRRNAEKFEKAAADAEADKRETLETINRHAEELIAKTASAAKNEALEIRRQADKRMKEAVQLIFWEICEKCQ